MTKLISSFSTVRTSAVQQRRISPGKQHGRTIDRGDAIGRPSIESRNSVFLVVRGMRLLGHCARSPIAKRPDRQNPQSRTIHAHFRKLMKVKQLERTDFFLFENFT